MVDKPKTDTVMKFVLGSKPVDAECTLDVANSDPLMDGFKAATATASSNFFEVQDFDFALSLKESDGEGGHEGGAKNAPASTGSFAAWRSASDSEYKEITSYPMEFDKFTFKRTVDRASPIFFQSCCTSTSFNSAALVKRIAQGGDQAAMGFLRIDFTDVLLTGVDWSDGELVQEGCDFICRKMVITMRQQLASGTIASSKYLITWDATTDRSKGVRLKNSSGG